MASISRIQICHIYGNSELGCRSCKSIVVTEDGFGSVDSIKLQEEDDEKPAAISGLECCKLLQVRKSWDSVFDKADPLIEKDLASEACSRDNVRFCLFGLIAMLVAHYLIFGCFCNGVEKSLCVVMVGLSLVLRIMGVGLVVCLCTWGFFGVTWNHRRTCSCRQDVEQCRTPAEDADERAQKAQWPKQFITDDAQHDTRDQHALFRIASTFYLRLRPEVTKLSC